MKLYLAGPMRNYENFNFQAFEDGMRYLEWQVDEVVSPHEIDMAEGYVTAKFDWVLLNNYETDKFQRRFSSVELTDTFDIETVLRRDIREITSCDAIVFLPGSDNSEGARHEAFVAQVCGLQFYEVVPWVFFDETSHSDQMKLGAEIQAEYWNTHTMIPEDSF